MVDSEMWHLLSGAVHIVHVAASCVEIAQSEKKQET